MKHLSLTTTPAVRRRLRGIAPALAAVVLWSTVSVGTRLLLHDRDTFSVAFLSASRLTLAALAFIVLRVWYSQRAGVPFWAPVKQTGWLLIAALSIFLNYLLYNIGLRYTTAGATAVISQIHTIATVLLAALLLDESLTRRKLIGMGVATAGVLLVVIQGASPAALFTSSTLWGNLIQVVAALIWPLYAIGQTKLLRESGNQQALMPIFVIAALLSILVLPFSGPSILHPTTPLDWSVLLFLGLGSTAAAYWLFAVAVQRIETSESTMTNVLIPPISVLMAHGLLGEPLSSGVIAGSGLVVVGLVLLVWQRESRAPVRRDEHPRKAA